MYENSQMEVEDYNVKYNNLVNENLELKEKEELLHHTQTKLANIKHKTEKDKKMQKVRQFNLTQKVLLIKQQLPIQWMISLTWMSLH